MVPKEKYRNPLFVYDYSELCLSLSRYICICVYICVYICIYVYMCIYVCVYKYSGLVSMNYVLYRFVSFNIYLLSTYHMARQCFKLRWVGCRGQQVSLFGGTYILDGSAIKKISKVNMVR